MNDTNLAIPMADDSHFTPVDPSTGVYTYDIFTVLLDHEIRYFERDGKRCSIAFLDIDFDRASRGAIQALGEEGVVRNIADIIKSTIRQVDSVAMTLPSSNLKNHE